MLKESDFDDNAGDVGERRGCQRSHPPSLDEEGTALAFESVTSASLL